MFFFFLNIRDDKFRQMAFSPFLTKTKKNWYFFGKYLGRVLKTIGKIEERPKICYRKTGKSNASAVVEKSYSEGGQKTNIVVKPIAFCRFRSESNINQKRVFFFSKNVLLYFITFFFYTYRQYTVSVTRVFGA